MSKEKSSKKSAVHLAHESGAHGGNKPGESGGRDEKRNRVHRESPSREQGAHSEPGGKTNHERTTLRAAGDINEKPKPTLALSRKEVSNLQA